MPQTHPIYNPLDIQPDGDVLNSGWCPVSEQDKQQLAMSQGVSSVDHDRLMAMPPRDTFLWRWLDTALKIYHKDENYRWNHQYQKYGTCVGQSDKVAVDDLMALNSLLYGEEFQGRSSVAGAYTFGRVEVAGQPGRWEGSNGYQSATGNIKFGIVLLRDLDLPDDATDADENIAMKWTASRQGVPEGFEDKAQNLLVKEKVSPKTAMEGAKYLQAGCPMFVGTTYLPTGVCNDHGVCPCKRSRGGHEMAIRGVVYDPASGKPLYFLIQQSWFSGWARGGRLIDDQPPESVWITARDYEIMIAEGDSNAIIGFNGLKYVD